VKSRGNLALSEPVGKALYAGGLLAAIFLAPIIGGNFKVFPGALIFSLLCLSAVGKLLARPARLFPATPPLSSFYLALAGLLLVSGISYFSSFSRFATDLELIKLGAGALLFWLVLQNRVLSRESRVCPERPALSGVEGSRRIESQETKITHPKAKHQKKLPPVPRPAISTPSGLGLAVFLILIAIGLATQDWSLYSFEQKLVLFTLILLALGFISFRFWRNPMTTLPLWETAVASGGVVAGYGIYDWLFMRLIADNPKWNTFSTFFNPNPFGGFLGMVLFLALGGLLFVLTRRKERYWGFIFPALAALLILIALPATDSKGAYFSIYLAVLVFLVLLITARHLTRPKKALMICLLLFISLAAPIGWILTHPPLKAKVAENLSLQNHSNMFRYLTWKASFDMAKAYPWLGVGPGAFESGFGRFAIAGYTRRAHQNYLEAAATTGFPGMICFIWLLGSGVVGVSQAFRRSPGGEKFLAAGSLGALLVMIFHSLLDYDWYIGACQLYFFLAVALGIDATSPREISPALVRRPWLVWIGIVGLLLLAGKALILGGAERAFDRADQLRIQGKYWEAKDHLEAAQRLAPVYAKADWQLGVVLARDLKRFSEALLPLQQATALEPKEATYWNSLGEVQARLGEFDQALQAFAKATEENPQFLRPLLNSGEINLLLGRPAEAVLAWDKIVQIQQSPAGKYTAIDYEVKTEYAEAHYGLGLAGSKDFAPGEKTAFQHFQAALKILSDYDRFGRELDEQRSVIGGLDPGKAERLKLLKAKCLYRRAQWLEGRGQKVIAQSDFRQAAELVPKIAFYIVEEDRQWEK